MSNILYACRWLLVLLSRDCKHSFPTHDMEYFRNIKTFECKVYIKINIQNQNDEMPICFLIYTCLPLYELTTPDSHQNRLHVELITSIWTKEYQSGLSTISSHLYQTGKQAHDWTSAIQITKISSWQDRRNDCHSIKIRRVNTPGFSASKILCASTNIYIVN